MRVLNGTLNVLSGGALGTGTSPVVLGDTSGTGRAQLTLGPALTTFSRDLQVTAGSTTSTPHTINGVSGVNVTLSGNVALGQTLQLSFGSTVNSGTYTFTGQISGAGSIRQEFGTAAFTGHNTFSGGYTLNALPNFLVGLGSNSDATGGPLGTGAVTFDTFGGGFRPDHGPRVLNNPIASIASIATATNFAVGGLHDLTLTGPVNFASLTSPLALNLYGRGTTTFGGPFTASADLSKNGPATLVLANPAGNALTGAVALNAGVSYANNTTGSATGTGAVTVGDGAVLGGNGRIAGTTAVQPGGSVQPGANAFAIGTLTFDGNVSHAAGSALTINLDNDAASQMALAGGTLTYAGPGVMIDVHNVGSELIAGSYSYTIVDTGTVPIAFNGGTFNAADFTLLASFAVTSLTLTNPTASTLVLNFSTPVPEPLTLLAVGMAVVAVARRRRN